MTHEDLILRPWWHIKTWSLDLDKESGPNIDTSNERFAASTKFGSCLIRISLSYQYLNLGPRWSIKASMRYQDLILIPRTKCPQRPSCLDCPIRISMRYQDLILGPRWGIKTWYRDFDAVTKDQTAPATPSATERESALFCVVALHSGLLFRFGSTPWPEYFPRHQQKRGSD
jgi:hypothetical protein